jgi:competence ComEA-like helix-hairpin-helix protein
LGGGDGVKGIFTRDERGVIVFLVIAVLVGVIVLAVGRVDPSRVEGLLPSTATVEEEVAESLAPVWPLNLNTAGETELVELPGIGPVRAGAIIELRQTLGRFSDPEDLLKVKGIGRRTLERMRPMITVDEILLPLEAEGE